MKFNFLLLVAVVAVCSCVPIKDRQYLQGDALQIDYQTKYVEYRLKSEDILQIKVFTTTEEKFNFFIQAQAQLAGGGGDPLLSGFVIDDQGNIELPVIGNVLIHGLTINEAQKRISDLLQGGGLESPKVVIKILSFQYTVLGEVGAPGIYNNYTGKINILEAIAQAGDLGRYADRRNINIVRYQNNNARILNVNVLDRSILSNPNFYIQPNDQIIVDPIKASNARDRQQTIAITLGLLSSLASFALIIDRLELFSSSSN